MFFIDKLKQSAYRSLAKRYPVAISIYADYKSRNMEYHKHHKSASRRFLGSLLACAKGKRKLHSLKIPHGIFNPLKYDGAQIDKKLSRNEFYVETAWLQRESPALLAKKLLQYDVVSFDIFDTCLFRPFSNPTDLFYLLEAKNGIINFKKLRIEAEKRARQNAVKKNGEVNIYEIYEELGKICFLTANAADEEIATEISVCYANEYILEVYNILRKHNKEIVFVSDMYLPKQAVADLLMRNGFDGQHKIYLSCDYGKNKVSGELFEIVKANYVAGQTFAHIGDDVNADVKGASLVKNFTPYYYAQCNFFGNMHRVQTPVGPTSSMYRGIVNNYIYNGANELSAREQFGFVYAGPLVYGYLNWINTFCKNNQLDCIVFTARDMEVFYNAYTKHFNQIDSVYAVVSRFAVQELIVGDFPDEFIHHAIRSRSNRNFTVEKAFKATRLDVLLDYCTEYGIDKRDIISSDNIEQIEKMFRENVGVVTSQFHDNEIAAKKYFQNLLKGKRNLCVVDLGWRGSVLAYLQHLLVNKWHLCDNVKGVLLGCAVSESFTEFSSRGLITSYAFDHLHNRDYLLNNPNPTSEYISIRIIEAIFTSCEGGLLEYNLDKNGNPILVHSQTDSHSKKTIMDVQTGIMKFVEEFSKHIKGIETYYPITAVDSFEPLSHVLHQYEYVANMIGDIADAPYALPGLSDEENQYLTLDEIMRQYGLIKK